MHFSCMFISLQHQARGEPGVIRQYSELYFGGCAHQRMRLPRNDQEYRWFLRSWEMFFSMLQSIRSLYHLEMIPMPLGSPEFSDDKPLDQISFRMPGMDLIRQFHYDNEAPLKLELWRWTSSARSCYTWNLADTSLSEVSYLYIDSTYEHHMNSSWNVWFVWKAKSQL